MSPKIERRRPYMQITDHYRQQIQDGVLKEGDQLPTVAEIASEWGVAHATAARAIGQLQVESLVMSTPRGSFVAAQSSKANSPYDRVRRARRTGSTDATGEHHRVTSAELVKPPAYVAELLDLEPGAQVVRREFVTLSDKRLSALTVTWYPASLADQVPELLTTNNGNVGAQLKRLEDVVGAVTRGRDFFHARGADAREAAALGIPVGAAILAGAWLLWASTESGDKLVEYGETCLPPRATVSYPYDVLSELSDEESADEETEDA